MAWNRSLLRKVGGMAAAVERRRVKDQRKE